MKLTEIIDVEFSDDEDCHPRNIESQSISLSLSNPNLELEIYLAKQVDDKTIFYINSGPTLFMINSCSQAMENLENVAREIVSNGFSFPNAFEFDNCSSEGNINKIIYSIDDGIVFIEFENGSYLKLL